MKRILPKPVPADVIADIAAKLEEETRANYDVAAKLDVDWCPCCGINFRFRHADGRFFAKFIATPDIARQIGAQLIATSARVREITEHPEIHQMAVADMLARCASAKQ
ncbi:hypothetical protein ASC80_01680 [Afipia sp. Root123D2]|uniref:hypothetical protein n=1 Tax=Afipia sp. Root123D2 TaxID=1736436 RepID=UPI0006FBCB23|nr:hypothetical protein [Afipia sp. Root123D2]KQW22133.1 hypothetical protein ASC80_01680 [Afipia sp. Root123D2]